MKILSEERIKDLIAMFAKVRKDRGFTLEEGDMIIGWVEDALISGSMAKLVLEGKIVMDVRNGEIRFKVNGEEGREVCRACLYDEMEEMRAPELVRCLDCKETKCPHLMSQFARGMESGLCKSCREKRDAKDTQ